MAAYELETKSEAKTNGFILIKCFPGYEKNIFTDLKKLGGKIQVSRVDLAYDFVVKDLSKSSEEFRDRIRKIRKVPHIMSVTILFTNHGIGVSKQK